MRTLTPSALSRALKISFLVALSLAAYGGRAPAANGDESPQEPRAEVLFVLLGPNGFNPSEINVPAGTYLLVVSNRSGLDRFALQLDSESRGREAEARPPRRRRDWKHLLKLTPGRYVLSEPGRPDWNCRITVTPR